jgi:hypothetical protein
LNLVIKLTNFSSKYSTKIHVYRDINFESIQLPLVICVLSLPLYRDKGVFPVEVIPLKCCRAARASVSLPFMRRKAGDSLQEKMRTAKMRVGLVQIGANCCHVVNAPTKITSRMPMANESS